ncbi:hypothetical protein AB6A40_002271 [Gnathostoma spinigerum]|uniref:Uncharacterized protein n=1 Tax=Gnathostoma spinigerum TaxID=75299 RepID=A0ABD6EG85_9BILA
MVERKSSSRSQSIGESSSKCNILEKRCVAVHCEEKHSSSGAIVRRRSWRTHYVRPNKSFDEESYRKIQVRRSSLLKLHHNSSSNLSMPMCSPSRSFSSSMRKRFAELNPNISDVLIAHSSSIKNIPEPSLSQLSFV